MVNKKLVNKKKGFNTLVDPIIPEFKLKDIMQVIIGASILAVPVGFTEETWNLGASLPMINVLGLFALSIFFISICSCLVSEEIVLRKAR